MLRRWVASLLLVAACSTSERLPPLLVQGDGLIALAENGTQVELLATDAGAVASQASWAPDATYAVWTEFDSAANVARIAMGNGESQRRIDGGTIPFFYGFSPDGKNIAYLGSDPEGGGVAMGLVDVTAGDARLVDSGQPFYFDWTADSSQLLVHANQTDTYLIDLAGQTQPLDISPGIYQAPAFLDDGRLLVVENGSLVAIDLTSQDRSVVADVETFSQFTAVGERIAFTANSQYAPGPLAVTTIDSGGQVPVTEEPVIAFEWSPDGELLYYLVLSAEGLIPAIWDGIESRRFAPTFPSTVFLQAYLPFWDQYSRFHTLWQADSSGFYLPQEGEEIAFYPAGSGDVTIVARGSMALPAPR